MYEIPSNYFYRLHHIRPRFKNNVEDVLLFMATKIAGLTPKKRTLFKEDLNRAIKLYPGNISKSAKTIDNWRTEISALFGLIEYENDILRPGIMAELLAEKQDLISFFRYFLFYFQYPGGHLKPRETLEMLKKGIRFKPVKYLIQTLLEGSKKTKNGKKFGITKYEATHCIFNDLRVSRDNRPIEQTLNLILNNRKQGIQYDTRGDIVRYAGDILDYMELADLVRLMPNYQYYLNTSNLEVIESFINDDSYFTSYETLYNKNTLDIDDVNTTQESWFHYVNSKLSDEIFQADTLSIIEEYGESSNTDENLSKLVMEVRTKIREDKEKGKVLSTKEIGDTGEALVIQHEKNRLHKHGRDDLVHLVVKIPENLAVGYDIKSYEVNNEELRYIEVKTTTSIGKLATKSFCMSTNEWRTAKSAREKYYIYRLMISKKDISLFIIQDPVGKERQDLLNMIPRNGADITYQESAGYWEELLA
ncbi:MAG: DUF3883 domain-containing protein [Xenococcus sp. (in: cyanobacteria)]